MDAKNITYKKTSTSTENRVGYEALYNGKEMVAYVAIVGDVLTVEGRGAVTIYMVYAAGGKFTASERDRHLDIARRVIADYEDSLNH